MPNPTVAIDDALLDQIDEDRHNTPRSPWLRNAARTQLLINNIEDNNAGLPDDWVERALYDYIERRQTRVEV